MTTKNNNYHITKNVSIKNTQSLKLICNEKNKKRPNTKPLLTTKCSVTKTQEEKNKKKIKNALNH